MNAAPNPPEFRDLTVVAREEVAAGIIALTLEASDSSPLDPHDAGAHINLRLPDGMRRSYSLLRPSAGGGHHEIGVQLSPVSRGGSAWIHQHLIPGATVSASRPGNSFALHEGTDPAVLIAGGIGITPLLSMATALSARDAEWQLHYAVRSRDQLAFVEELEDLAADSRGSLVIHVDDEAGMVLDLAGTVNAASLPTHVYCCGPSPMLNAFEAVASARGERAHTEHFAAGEDTARPDDDTFEVQLARGEMTVTINPGTTILAELKKLDLDVNYSCEEGICGTCETKVLAGLPDHRDSVLSEAERQANTSMMICVSRCKIGPLVLDA